MTVIWTATGAGLAMTGGSALSDVLLKWDAGTQSATKLTIKHGDNRIEFTGDFHLSEAGAITGGTVHGFKVFEGDALTLSAKGYDFDVNELATALDHSSESSFLQLTFLLAGEPMTMKGSVKADILAGFFGDATIYGFGGKDTLGGGYGDDALYGGSGKDFLVGFDGRDSLFGGKGADRLAGGTGRDILSGDAGADHFIFTDKLGGGNVDHITDFHSGFDRIELDSGHFAGLVDGPLAKSAFHAGAAAQDADDRILYDKHTGALYFDADGTGGTGAVKFAVLDGHPTLAASDFLIT